MPPIDYSTYAKNWKSEIRPAILERDNNCCKICLAKNGEAIFRGWVFTANGKIEVYQTYDGKVYRADSGIMIFDGSVYVAIDPISGDPNQKAIKVVLTIAHLDHDISNNDYENLAALCQKCHLGIDLKHHMANARETNRKKKGLQNLF
jgi:5-methylcytosine-specific restriction endonuclease McrA